MSRRHAPDGRSLPDVDRLLQMIHGAVETLAEGCRHLDATRARLYRRMLDDPLVTSAIRVGRARAATATTFAARRSSAWDTPVAARCPRCGLRILGRHGVAARAAAHVACCPGGDRSAETWFPLVHRADARPARPGPMLRVLRGGAPPSPR